MNNKTERLIRIYNRLRSGPVTLNIISSWAQKAGIEISNRQLYRDLNSLLKLTIIDGEYVEEYCDEKNRKTWKLEYAESSDTINQFDINSFLLFKNFVPNSIMGFRNESFEKFERILYRNISKNKIENRTESNEWFLKKTNWYDNLYGVIEHEKLDNIIWALENKRVIKINSSDINPSFINKKKNPFPLSIYPMELVFHRGRAHICGLEIKTDNLLIFTVDESLEFELTNDIFNRKKFIKKYIEQIKIRFGISNPIDDKVYNVKIEFSTGYALSMKNFYWHDSATWKIMKNGNYMLHLKCSINRELVGFIAQGLDKVKVHNPKKLKDLLVIKYQESINVHRGLSPNENRSNYGY